MCDSGVCRYCCVPIPEKCPQCGEDVEPCSCDYEERKRETVQRVVNSWAALILGSEVE